jgi:small subunit ribosomal protein S11
MARLAGINIPDNKHAVISLTYIFGIGRKTAQDLCAETGVNPAAKVQDLTEEELDRLRTEITKLSVEGDLRSTSSVCLIWVVIVGFVIDVTCRFTVSVPRRMLVHAKVQPGPFVNNELTVKQI